jgi:hypothetical protein
MEILNLVKKCMIDMPIDDVSPPIGDSDKFNNDVWIEFGKTEHTTLHIYHSNDCCHLTRLGQNTWYISSEKGEFDFVTFDGPDGIIRYLNNTTIELLTSSRGYYDNGKKCFEYKTFYKT